MRKLFIAFSMIVVCANAVAQNIIGTITDENGQPMEFVTVSLHSLPDSAIVVGCITDEKGQFGIERKVENGFVQASFIGYRPQNIPVSAFATPQTIRMQTDATMLSEVVISRALPKTKLLDSSSACLIASIQQTASTRALAPDRMLRVGCNIMNCLESLQKDRNMNRRNKK